MACRKALLLYLGLLGPLVGCVPATMEQKGAIAEQDGEQVAKKPGTYVAFGDFRASASFARETPVDAQQNLREEAKLSYLKAIEIDPKHVPAYLALARLQQANKDFSAALKTYQRALTVTQRDAVLWYELGMCQARQQIWSDAVNSLKKACQLSPDNKSYQTTLGYTLARSGQFSDGLTILIQTQGEARGNYDLGRMLIHLNQPELARKHIVAALTLDPKLAGAADMLARLDGKVRDEATTTAGRPSGPGTPSPMPVILTKTSNAQGGQDLPKSANAANDESSRLPLRVPPLPVIPIRSSSH